jgi:hypothetical protein
MRPHGPLQQLTRHPAEFARHATTLFVCCLVLSVSLPLFAATLPAVAPGTAVDAGQWRVKLLSARVSPEHPLPYPAKRSAAYLLLEIEFTNLMERSSRDLSFVVHVDQPELPKLGEPSFVAVRDMALTDRLHPDMPETLLLVWPWPAEVPVPPELRLSIHAKTFKKADNLVGSPGWFNPAAIATVALPVSAK